MGTVTTDATKEGKKGGKMDTVAIDVKAIKEGRKAGTVTIDAAAIGGMIENALAFCAQKTRFRDEEALEAIREGDCSVCSYFRYGLSKEIGACLGDIDASVQAVYTYEPEYSTGVTSADGVGPALEGRGINLIVSVDRRSAALSSVIASLNDGLKEARERLVCPEANGSCHALDVKVADKEEVASGQGYGALISSIYVRPLRVWAREI